MKVESLSAEPYTDGYKSPFLPLKKKIPVVSHHYEIKKSKL